MEIDHEEPGAVRNPEVAHTAATLELDERWADQVEARLARPDPLAQLPADSQAGELRASPAHAASAPASTSRQCLLPWTLVLTSEGWKHAWELQVDDELESLDADGSVRIEELHREATRRQDLCFIASIKHLIALTY